MRKQERQKTRGLGHDISTTHETELREKQVSRRRI